MTERLNEDSSDPTLQDKLMAAASQLNQASADLAQAQRSLKERRVAVRELLAGRVGSTVLLWATATWYGFNREADERWVYVPMGPSDQPGVTVIGEYAICAVNDRDVEISEPGCEERVRMRVPYEEIVPASAEQITAAANSADALAVSNGPPTA